MQNQKDLQNWSNGTVFRKSDSFPDIDGMIKNAGAGWQRYKKNTGGERANVQKSASKSS